jgi:tetratricopeptide (TPR) repeat protein
MTARYALPLALAALLVPAALAQGALPGLRAEGVRLYHLNRLEEAAPMLAQVAGANPDDDEARLMMADALRQWGQRADDYVLIEEGLVQARQVAERPGACNSAALTIAAEAVDPVLSVWALSDADRARAFLTQAVACDSSDGNAWLRLWPHALRAGDHALAARALGRLYETAFWTAPRLAMARWILASVPEGAVLLAQGDDDAAPMATIQQAEGLRPDVTVLPVSWLRHPWFARLAAAQTGFPLPDSLSPRPWSDPGPFSFRDAPTRDSVLTTWLAAHAAGALPRPLAAALTLDPSILGARARGVADHGAYLVPADRDGLVLAAAAESTARLDGSAFLGPRVSAQDRSTARRAFPADLGGIALFQALQVAVSHAQAGDRDAAEAAYAHAVAFAEAAGLSEAFLIETARAWIDDALASGN